MNTSRFGIFLTAITLAACVGCGGSTDQPELGEVEGTVTVNGTPLANATVEFRPEGEGGRPSIGTTAEDGTYELQYTVDATGAKLGQHTVMVRLNEDEEDYEEEEGDDDDEPEDSGLPAAASDGSLKKTVEAGSNTINIEL